MLPFITAYDPLGGSAGSIDPLGAMQTYGSLADLLLPGFTTITTRSRYLSMLCAALANAENHRTMLPGASGLTQRRKAVEPFERLWALACVTAQAAGHEGAADGLRGISYAKTSFQNFATSGKNVTCDFTLLKYQSRTGAVGTYWTTMVGGQLVDPDTGRLSAEGVELAEQFPKLPLENKDLARIADPEQARRVSMPRDDFAAWSEECHLKAAGPEERRQLSEVLTADDRREYVSQAIRRMPDGVPTDWDTTSLTRLGESLEAHPQAKAMGLPIVVEAIVVTEQFHEAILALFETLLWWGTQNASKSIGDLAAEKDFCKMSDRCRETAQRLREYRDRCELPEVRVAIEGLLGFAYQIDRCRSELEVITALMDRHHHVQSGKVDGGIPKRDWITWDDSSLLRPSPRFQRNERPMIAGGIKLTHPYRLEPFVYMLRETGVLAGNA